MLFAMTSLFLASTSYMARDIIIHNTIVCKPVSDFLNEKFLVKTTYMNSSCACICIVYVACIRHPLNLVFSKSLEEKQNYFFWSSSTQITCVCCSQLIIPMYFHFKTILYSYWETRDIFPIYEIKFVKQ